MKENRSSSYSYRSGVVLSGTCILAPNCEGHGQQSGHGQTQDKGHSSAHNRSTRHNEQRIDYRVGHGITYVNRNKGHGYYVHEHEYKQDMEK